MQLAYFMRGAIQYDDLMYRTIAERQIMSEFISERLESQQNGLNVKIY